MFRRAALGCLLACACGDNDKSVGFVAPNLDFGQTDCGATAAPHVLQLHNPTTVAYHFTLTLAGGASSPYLLEPDHGIVLPEKTLAITVHSRAIPQVSAVTDDLYGDTLTVTTDLENEPPHTVAIT